jgi:16S rRNA (adenine1518-N6/adenine1519-N6)-dimethyltransferase
MFSIGEIKQLCQELDIQPTKSKGQNFLINRDIVRKIIETAELGQDDIILEIGPGLGILTFEMTRQVKKLIAIELDTKLAGFLKRQKEIRKLGNLDIIHGDVLELLNYYIVKLLEGQKYKLVANLPYQISSRALRLLLESSHPPTHLVVMVQREVGERICELAGRMSVLSVMVQYYAEPRIIKIVGKGNFWPRPKVDSVILRISRRMNIPMDADENRDFFKLVKLGFSSRRKMLKNNLGKIYGHKKVEEILAEVGLSLKTRAQELSVDNWIGLYNKLVAHNQ